VGRNEIQQARLISAAAQVVEEVGYRQVTVSRVIERARVSRKTFYDSFANSEECMVALFDCAVDRARGAVAGADQESWQESLRTSLAEILRLIDEERGLARFCLVEALGGGERLLRRRAELLAEFAAAIDNGRRHTPAAREPAPIAAEGAVGAVGHILHARLCAGDDKPVSDLLGALMSIVVLPYLGDAAADRELARPAPERKSLPRRNPPKRASLPGLSRLTYRTALVLSAIHTRPGSSNQQVGRDSGITDQGQMSKLLSRLAGIGLVENRGPGQQHGLANAWHLTTRGAELEHVVRTRFGLLDSDRRALRRKSARRASAAPRQPPRQ
jgi:AcrR family transcriptional regulator/DNA-binding MarR family transcriptional regulator